MVIPTQSREYQEEWQACIQWGTGTIRITIKSMDHHGIPGDEFWDWDVNGQPGQRTITSHDEYLKVWFEDETGVNPVQYIDPGDGACQSSPPPSIPYAVCLDMTVGDFIELTGYTPQSKVFTVDGNSYEFDQHIYWSVPYNVFQSWTLVFDSIPILSVSQSSDGNCQITAIS